MGKIVLTVKQDSYDIYKDSYISISIGLYCQSGRKAKVIVSMSKVRGLLFYIPYKKLHEQLPKIMESLKIIRQELETLGNNASVIRMYNF